MIINKEKKFFSVSIPKTGTFFRLDYYLTANDLLIKRKGVANIHLSAIGAKKWFLEYYKEDYNEYNKVIFVKNPWIRLNSIHNMLYGKKEIENKKDHFKKYVMEYWNRSMDRFYLLEDGSEFFDLILQADPDHLINSIQKVNEILDFQGKEFEVKISEHHEIYKEWWDQEMIDFIAFREKITIDKFNYTFDN